jgi:hypothetical protein
MRSEVGMEVVWRVERGSWSALRDTEGKSRTSANVM